MPAEHVEIVITGNATSGVRAAEESAAAVQGVGAASKESAAASIAAERQRMQALSQSAARARSFGATWSRYVSLPLAAVGAVAVKMSLDFHHAMDLVHTQAGASAKEVKNLTSQVEAFAASGRSTHGPKDLADALFHIESAGFRGAKAMDALKASEALATTGSADMEQTTNALVGAMRSGVQGAGNMTQAVGTLNAIVGAGNMRMDELTAAMGTGFLTNAKQMGLTLAQAGAGLATLTRQGQPATQSATRLSMAFRMMMSPTKQASDALNSIGLSANKLGILMQEHRFPDAVKLLAQHLDALGSSPQALQEKATVIREMFGARSSTGINAILQGLDQYDSALTQINQKTGEFNKLHASAMEDNANKLKAAWAQVQAALVKLGDVVLPMLAPLLEDLAKIVSGLAAAFGALPDPAQKFLVFLGALSIVVGPAIVAIASLTKAYAALRLAMLGTAAAEGAVGAGGVAAGAGGALAASRGIAGIGGSAGAFGAGEAAVGAAGLGTAALTVGAIGAVGAGGYFGLRALGLTEGTPMSAKEARAQLSGRSRPGASATGAGDINRSGAALTLQKQINDLLTTAQKHHQTITAAQEMQIKQDAVLLQQTGAITDAKRHQVDVAAEAASHAQAEKDQATKEGRQFAAELPAAMADELKQNGGKVKAAAKSLTDDAIGQIKNMPPAGRKAGAQTMIAQAEALQAQGKLPRAAVTALVRDINAKWPGMIPPAIKNAKALAAGVTNVFQGLGDAISHPLQTVEKLISGFLGSLHINIDFGGLVQTGKNIVGGVQDFAGGLLGGGGGGKGGKKKAMGGVLVPGSSSGDSVPVHLGGRLAGFVEPREGLFVLNRTAMGAFASLNDAVPRRAGGGPLEQAGINALELIGGGAARFLRQHAPKPSAGGASFGPSGVGSYMGISMANWVVQALQFAAKHGSGNPQPTSGYRPGVDPHTATGTSEHQGTQYPHGAVDFGGMWDPPAFPKKMAVVNATRGFKYPLLAPIGFHDDGHASGTGHMRGGILARLKAGGAFPPDPAHGTHWIHPRNPSHWTKDEAATLLWQAGLSAGQGGDLSRVIVPESGGDPRARNKSGATGLFQILGAVVMKGHPLTNPIVNAFNAAAKYRDSGLGPWAASRSGWQHLGPGSIISAASRIGGGQQGKGGAKGKKGKTPTTDPTASSGIDPGVQQAYDESLQRYNDFAGLLSEATRFYTADRALSMRLSPVLAGFASEQGLALPGPYGDVPALNLPALGPPPTLGVNTIRKMAKPKVVHVGGGGDLHHHHHHLHSFDKRGNPQVKTQTKTTDKDLGRKSRHHSYSPGGQR